MSVEPDPEIIQLAEAIRSEAWIASRPGQMRRLEDLADAVAVLATRVVPPAADARS